MLVRKLISASSNRVDHLEAKDLLESFSDLVDRYFDGVVTDILWLFPKCINDLIFGKNTLFT
jgi:hypothetical protein